MRTVAILLLVATVAPVIHSQGWTPVSSSTTAAVNTTSVDAGPSLSSDGLTMYFSSNRTVIAPAPLPIGYEVYYTTRTSLRRNGTSDWRTRCRSPTMFSPRCEAVSNRCLRRPLTAWFDFEES